MEQAAGDVCVAPDAFDHHDDPLCQVYARLLGDPGSSLVVAHLAQSLDGCVALACGESQWISGPEDLLHTHRLRALVDGVIVGVQTLLDDDPRLTVRRCEGVDPVRVVLDPRGRAGADHRVFRGGPRTLRLCARAERDHDVEVPLREGRFHPEDILETLDRHGLRRLLVEGGGVTVSHFLTAGCLDRLHLVVAPVLIGGGRRAFPRPLIERLAKAQRLHAEPIALGRDWLFDCGLERA